MMDIKLLLFSLFIISSTNGVVKVPKLKLNDGREMPAIGYGTWRSTDLPSENEVENAVRWAMEAGYGHIDTAWLYNVEQQVGKGVKGFSRDKFYITAKLWSTCLARDKVVPTLRASLLDLKLDYVDLYVVHWPCFHTTNQTTYMQTDYLDTWQGMIEAKSLGLTKSIGVSNFNQKMIDRILKNGYEKPAALLIEVNLNFQQPELLSYCKAQNIVVMGYTPFGSLYYSRAAADSPPPRVDDPVLVDLAHKHNKTVPQIVLRYLVELGVVPLPKSGKKNHIEQNIDIFDFELTESEKTSLKAFDRGYRTEAHYDWMENFC